MTIKRCYPALVGASVAENQLVQNGNFEDTSNWFSVDGSNSVSGNVLTYTPTTIRQTYFENQVFQANFNVPTNHVVFLSCDTYAPYSNGFYYSVRTNSIGQSGVGISNKPLTPNTWNHCEKLTKSTDTITDIAFYWSMNTNYQTGDSVKLRNVKLIDLTKKFGSAIADYAYSLEQATAGSGIAWLRSYGFITDEYKEYNAGTIESVEATAKVVRDENNENAVTYPLGSDVLRGIFKLDASNNLYADGDRKTADGTITRYYGTRAYQEGDESLADAITDGTTTVYKLSTPTTEISTPFTSPQLVYPDGTEEFITENNVPVGHETSYQL